MYKKTGYRLSDKDKKSASVTVRCVPEMQKRVKNKADALGVTVSEFVSDCIEMKMKRNTKNDKRKVRILVEAQETLNQIILSLTPQQQEIKDKLIDYSKGVMELWDC